MSQNGKGDKNNRVKDWFKYWQEHDSIFDKKKVDRKDNVCYICKSSSGKPSHFKQFCSRCGNQP